MKSKFVLFMIILSILSSIALGVISNAASDVNQVSESSPINSEKTLDSSEFAYSDTAVVTSLVLGVLKIYYKLFYFYCGG